MFDTADFTLTAYTANDGENLAVYDWPLAEGRAQRGTVLLVHGLGEHAGRYHAVAQHLNAWGFAVRAYDQYGHGQSGGPRGGLNHDMRLLDDLADMVDATRARTPEGLPLVLLGHSMGGLVAARFVAMHLRPVDALVLSSPALDPGLNAVQKILLATLPGIRPWSRPTRPTRCATTASVRAWPASSPTVARPPWRARRTGACPRCSCGRVTTAWCSPQAALPSLPQRHPAWCSRSASRRSGTSCSTSRTQRRCSLRCTSGWPGISRQK